MNSWLSFLGPVYADNTAELGEVLCYFYICSIQGERFFSHLCRSQSVGQGHLACLIFPASGQGLLTVRIVSTVCLWVFQLLFFALPSLTIRKRIGDRMHPCRKRIGDGVLQDDTAFEALVEHADEFYHLRRDSVIAQDLQKALSINVVECLLEVYVVTCFQNGCPKNLILIISSTSQCSIVVSVPCPRFFNSRSPIKTFWNMSMIPIGQKC